MRLRVLRCGRWRRWPLARRGRSQVRARAVPAARRRAASALAACLSGAVRAARVLRAGAVGAGRRAAGVACAAGGGHGSLRGGAHRLRRRVRLAAAPRPPRRALPPRHRAVRAYRVRRRARPPRHAGAALLGAARHDGVARAGAGRGCGAGRLALPRVGRGARVRTLRGAGALPAGAGDVDVLLGSTGYCGQRAAHSAGGTGYRLRSPAPWICPYTSNKSLPNCVVPNSPSSIRYRRLLIYH